VDYKVFLLKRATLDIDEIAHYLSQFYPGTVGRFLEGFEKALGILEENPYIYGVYTEKPQYHRMIIGDYLVFYKIFENAKTVRVYRVLHGRRNLGQFV
jgi:plasmid stabilization system protein ParE